MSKVSVISEFLSYLMENKKWWLIPVVLFLIFLGALIVLAEGSTIAPFIYALF